MAGLNTIRDEVSTRYVQHNKHALWFSAAMDVKKEIGRRIREGRKAKDLTQNDLAELAGWAGQSRISMYERGEREPDMGDLRTLRKHIEFDFSDLLHAGETPATYTAVPATERIPVVGTAQAGDDGFWEELQYPTGHGEGFVRYPSKDPNAYALRIKGDSMRPRIKPGEFILVEPNSALVAGEEVMVTTNDGRSMVKLLGPRRDGAIEFQSINEDHRPFTIEESNIRSMHYVSAILKSGRYYRDGE